MAGCAVEAWAVGTEIGILAKISRKACTTLTCECVQPIDTRATILTRILLTVVGVRLTPDATEARYTITDEEAIIVGTCASINARCTGTGIHSILTALSLKKKAT